MTPRSSIVGACGLLLLAHVTLAQAQEDDAATSTTDAAADTGDLVSLIEFLGEFTTQEGEWLDPQLLLETEPAAADRRSDADARRDADPDDEQRDERSDE